MSSRGRCLILVCKKSAISWLRPGLPEKCIANSEPARLKIVPKSLTISVVSPVAVKSKCINCLLCLIAFPSSCTISICSFSEVLLSDIVFQDRFTFYSLRLCVISIRNFFICFGTSLFYEMSKFTNFFCFDIIYCKTANEKSFRLTLTNDSDLSWFAAFSA